MYSWASCWISHLLSCSVSWHCHLIRKFKSYISWCVVGNSHGMMKLTSWVQVGLVLWHINHCWLFNAKSSLYISIKYIWFGLVWFYGISTIVGYFMPNPVYTYISNMYDLVWLGFIAYQPLLVISCQILFTHIYRICMIWFGLVLWHINHCWLFHAKSCLHIYIKYVWFGLIGFYCISTIVGYLMPNSVYTYILDIWLVNIL